MTITILFVSTGGICRAPMAVGVLRVLAERSGLSERLTIEAAAISDSHAGQEPSILAIEATARRGCRIANLRARQIVAEDIVAADHLLAMDGTHLAALRWIAPPGLTEKPKLLMSHAPAFAARNIPDPFGGSNLDYERAVDLIEAGCVGLLEHLAQELAERAPHQAPAPRPTAAVRRRRPRPANSGCGGRESRG